jgi:DNA-binding transcriptional MerR regulator
MAFQLFKKQQRAPPVERVKELSSHGFSEPEIIDVLRKEGYNPQEIDLALTQALKEKLQAPSKEIKEEKEKEEAKLPTFEEVAKKVQTQQPAETTVQYIQPQVQQYSWEDYFNYIDYLIHSRISEISKELEKINLKNQNLEKRIEEVNQNVRQTIVAKEESYHQILRKMEEINSSLNELSQRVNALEEILKEILPALIESVRSLSKLIQQK